ncbi:hypothetical protein CCUS01_07090 [Colletotrichum cuscutae]|uniref:Uncharacterized protein n=1 Tax=Colletotrichum cuscutae TaxID=1209917 RepID=A0AAI9V2M4_9PEZI|nr:hypothetical protein CCUS01_07090 [Colletotrichum cuscutae]
MTGLDGWLGTFARHTCTRRHLPRYSEEGSSDIQCSEVGPSTKNFWSRPSPMLSVIVEFPSAIKRRRGDLFPLYGGIFGSRSRKILWTIFLPQLPEEPPQIEWVLGCNWRAMVGYHRGAARHDEWRAGECKKVTKKNASSTGLQQR